MGVSFFFFCFAILLDLTGCSASSTATVGVGVVPSARGSVVARSSSARRAFFGRGLCFLRGAGGSEEKSSSTTFSSSSPNPTRCVGVRMGVRLGGEGTAGGSDSTGGGEDLTALAFFCGGGGGESNSVSVGASSCSGAIGTASGGCFFESLGIDLAFVLGAVLRRVGVTSNAGKDVCGVGGGVKLYDRLVRNVAFSASSSNVWVTGENSMSMSSSRRSRARPWGGGVVSFGRLGLSFVVFAFASSVVEECKVR